MPVIDLFQNMSLSLESGKSLSDISCTYQTYGKLNKAKSNAILICHALSGDMNVADKTVDGKLVKGWWRQIVGPKKAICTKKYYVICINTIGSCYGTTGPLSLNPKTKAPYGIDFPVVTIGDMVHVQKALLDALEIPSLHAVIGPSMGGMQALEWAIMYPDFINLCIPIACAAQLSPQSLAFNAIGRSAIAGDAQWDNGAYTEKNKPKKGLSLARMIGHVTYLSHQSLSQKFGRRLQTDESYRYDLTAEFQIESYLQYQGDKFVDRFDPNSYIFLAKAMSYFDLAKKYGTLRQAFKVVEATCLFISISSDWLYPSSQSKEMVRSFMKLNKNVSYAELDSPYGHDAFLIEKEQLEKLLSVFLEKTL